MVYKWCVVPKCTNTSIRSPSKVFVSVPTNPNKRRKWLETARRDAESIAPQSNVFMCEDHFNMEKDTINYMKYKMGFSQKILLADEAVPSKFDCQEDRKRELRLSGTEFFQEVLKTKRNNLVTECLQSSSAIETHIGSIQKNQSNRSPSPGPSDGKKPCFCPLGREISKIQQMEDVDAVDDNSEDDPEETISTMLEKDVNTFDYDMLEAGDSKIKSEILIHADFRCSVCHGDIVGFRYTCIQCTDWDMCAACEARGEHPAHYVLRLPAPISKEDCAPVLAAIRNHIEDLLRLEKEIHEVIIKEEIDIDEQVPLAYELCEADTASEHDRSVPDVNWHPKSAEETATSSKIEKTTEDTLSATDIMQSRADSMLQSIVKHSINPLGSKKSNFNPLMIDKSLAKENEDYQSIKIEPIGNS